MRGLPPPPPDFILIEAAWDINGRATVTSGWWLFAPGADSADPLQLETLLGDFFFGPLQDVLQVLPADTSCSVLRLSSYGTLRNRVTYAPAPNVGAVGNSEALNAALVWTWRTSRAGKGQDGHTWLPLSSTFVDDDKRSLKAVSWSQAQAAARAFALHVNALVSPDAGLCVFAIVHRSRAGRPLVTAEWEPVALGDACPHVATMSRRISSSRAFSSPF